MAGDGRNRRGTPQFRRGRLVSGVLGNEKHLTRLSGSLKPQPGERPIPPGTVGCSGRNCGVAVRIGQPQSQRRAGPFHEGPEWLSGNGKRSAGSPPTDGRRARSGNRLHGRRHRRGRRDHSAEDAPPQRIRTLKQPRCKRREIGIRRQRVAVLADSVRLRRNNRSGGLAQQPGSPMRRTATTLWKAADMRKPTGGRPGGDAWQPIPTGEQPQVRSAALGTMSPQRQCRRGLRRPSAARREWPRKSVWIPDRRGHGILALSSAWRLPPSRSPSQYPPGRGTLIRQMEEHRARHPPGNTPRDPSPHGLHMTGGGLYLRRIQPGVKR